MTGIFSGVKSSVCVFMEEIVTVGKLPIGYYLDLKRSCSSLEELADVRFQAAVTPVGQEGTRLLLFLNYCSKVAIKKGEQW